LDILQGVQQPQDGILQQVTGLFPTAHCGETPQHLPGKALQPTVDGAKHLVPGRTVACPDALHPAAELGRVQGGVRHGRTIAPSREMTRSGPEADQSMGVYQGGPGGTIFFEFLSSSRAGLRYQTRGSRHSRSLRVPRRLVARCNKNAFSRRKTHEVSMMWTTLIGLIKTLPGVSGLAGLGLTSGLSSQGFLLCHLSLERKTS
jgi:hypothetical protein